MAKIKNGHFGSYSGKIGAVTGFKRFGEYYIRQSITHNGSNTKSQAEHRTFFVKAVRFLGAFSQVFKVGFSGRTGEGKSAYNVGFKYNYDRGVVTPTATKLEDVVVAVGSHELPSQPTIANEDPGKITFGWSWETTDPVRHAEDKVFGVLRCEDENVTPLVIMVEGEMANREVITGYPAPWAGKTARAWMFSKSKLNGDFSNSVHLGRVSCE